MAKFWAPWTIEECLEFILQFKKHDVLWNSSSSHYYSPVEKEHAWNEIADIVKKPPEECRRKLESLKGSFRRERMKIRRGRTGGRVYKSRWFAYEALRFLSEHADGDERSRKTGKKKGERIYVECDVDLDNMVTTEENDTKPIITPQITGDSVVTEIATTSRPQRMSNRNNIYEDAEVDEELEDTGSQIQIQAEPCFELAPPCLSEASKDECDIYGQLISAKLKKMDDRTRDIAMHKIDNVLFNMKMNPIRDE